MILNSKLKEILKDILPPLLFRVAKKVYGKVYLRLHFLIPSLQKYITTLEELDREIERADEAAKKSDDALRQVLSEFTYIQDIYDFKSKDPYSFEYQNQQMLLYSYISGENNYNPWKNELASFNLETLKDNPFPYCTLSGNTVGEQLIAQGFLVKTMNLEPKSRILEFGPGWGNTTLHFSQMGYNVTAVEIDKKFIDLIDYRAKLLNQNIELINIDMLDFDSDQTYDAAIFFECFHHCSDHIKMLKKLDKLVSRDGIIVFGSEPITDDFPLPWGIRLDGISAWSIRKFGWLELGFNTSYFLSTLNNLGWSVSRHDSKDCAWATVFIARRRENTLN